MFKSLSLTQFFQEKLVSLLSSYLRDFSRSNISQLNLGLNSTLEMENLEIKEDLLLKQSLPFVINEGKIGRITINIPMMFKNTPMKIDIENIAIHIRPLVEQRSSEAKQKRMQKAEDNGNQEKTFTIRSYQERKLTEWEKKVKKTFQDLSQPTFAQRIIDSIINNMSISIKNLTIYYENISVLNVPTFLKISFRELNIQSTDQNWTPKFNPSPEIHYRVIEIKGLAVSINMNNDGQAIYNSQYRPAAQKQGAKTQTVSSSLLDDHRRGASHTSEKARYFIDENEALEAEYRKLRDREIFILLPLHVTIKAKKVMVLSRNKLTYDTSQQFWVETSEPIMLMLNKNHMRYIGALNQHIKLLQIVKKNLHLRPTSTPKERPALWWIYAVKSVVEERKRQTKFSRSSTNIMKMRKYVNLYKRKQTFIQTPWLLRLNEKELQDIKELEDQIPVESLIQFRELALIEVKSEAKRFHPSQPGGETISEVEVGADLEGMSDELRQMLDPNNLPSLFPSQTENVEATTSSSIKMQLDFDLKSFYMMITEPKEVSTIVTIDSRRHNLSSVRQWWEGNSGGLASKNKPLLMSMGSLDVPLNQKINIPDDIQEESNESFYTVEENTFQERNSELSMMKFQDILINEEELYLTEKVKDQSQKQVLSQEKQPTTKKNVTSLNSIKNQAFQQLDSWNQNLILIVEILRIRGLFCQLNNKKLMTKKPLELESIMITTAMNLPIAMEERDSRMNTTDDCLKYETLMQHILAANFEAILHKEEEHPFITFLKENNCVNFAIFFEVFLKDHQNQGAFIVNNIDAYIPFFDQSSHLHLDFPQEINEKFNSCLGLNYLRNTLIKVVNEYMYRTKKEEVIMDAFYALEAHINKDLLPSFLYSYGVLIFPFILQTFALSQPMKEIVVKNKLTDEHLKKFVDQLKGFYFKPKHSIILKFLPKERRKPHLEKPKNTKPIFSLSLNLTKSEANPEHEGTNFVIDLEKVEKELDEPLSASTEQEKSVQYGTTLSIDLHARPITIYLSPECFRSLILFLKSFPTRKLPKPTQKQKSDATDDMELFSYKEYHDLMDCLSHTRHYNIERRFDNSPEVIAQFESLSIKFFNFGSHYLGERRLSFNLKDISLRVKKPIESGLSLPPELKKLEKLYQLTSFRIESLELHESHYLNKIYQVIPILKTKFIVNIHECIYRNHLQHDDKKIHVLIPYLKIHIDDNFPLFIEIVKSFSKSVPDHSHSMKLDNFQEQNLFTGISTTDVKNLHTKLRALQKEHKPTATKNCSHCILLHKKSKSILNFFIGDLANYFKGVEHSPFAGLYLHNAKDLEANEDFSGLVITFKQSLAPQNLDLKHMILHLPLFILTKDSGFFKDNVIVHSTETGPIYLGTDYNLYNTKDREPIFAKFQPVIKTRKDFAMHLDDSFWNYFLQVEQKFRNKDLLLPEEKMTGNSPKKERGKGSTGGKSSFGNMLDEDITSVFVVLLRRKYKRRSLLRELEINAQQRIFQNFTALWIREISINFSSVHVLISLLNTLDTIVLVNKWIEQLGLSMNLTSQNTLAESSKTKKSQAMTLYQLKETLDRENFSLLIKRISSLTYLKPPKTIWNLEIVNFFIENLSYKSESVMFFATEHQEIIELFSIQRINFKTSPKSNIGYIQGINLKMNTNQGIIQLSIDKACKESRHSPNHPIIELPSSAKTNKKPNKGSNPSQRAFEMQFVFEDNKLANIQISLSPLSLYIDTLGICEEFSSLSMFKQMLSYQKTEIPHKLVESIFEKEIFEKTQADLLKRKKQIALNKQNNKSSSKFGPFAIHNSFKLLLQAEKISLHLVKDDITFILVDVSSVEFKMDPHGEYLVMIEKFSLIPYDSYYDNFFVNLSPDKPMKIKIYKENEYITIEGYHGKVIYMNRILQEFKRFKKQLTLELTQASKDVISNNLILEKSLEAKAKAKKDADPPKKPLVRIRVRDSCIIVPRTTNSKDALVIFGESAEVKVDLEMMNLDVPTPLTEDFIVLNRNQILREQNTFQKVRALMIVAEVEFRKGEAFYVIDDRKIHLGQSERAHITAYAPDHQILKDNWVFDTQVQADLGTFLLSMNFGSIDEVKRLILDNLKEQSKLFQLKTDNFENVQLRLTGKRFSFAMNRSNIQADIVKELLFERKDQDEEYLPKSLLILKFMDRDDGKDYEEHLDDIVQTMKAMSRY